MFLWVHKFTSHLQAKLADIDQTNLIFGSDEEFAAVKAVHLSFPNATRVLCAKHLKDNAIVNLGKSLPQPEVTKIITKLFGESGILASEDQVTFNEIRDELTHSYDIPYLSIEQVASQFGAVRFQASATTPLFASSMVG